MSRNGTGTYVLPAGNPVVTGTVITSTWANTTMSDIATALTGSIASDGQTVVTGNIQMGNNRIIGMADGIALTDAATLAQTINVNILSGNINGAIIGNTDPKAGTFTDLNATTSAFVPTIGNILDSSTKAASTGFVQSVLAAYDNGVTSFNTRKGAVTLLSADVTTALGYTPVQPNGTGATGTWNLSITGNAGGTSANITGVAAVANGGTGITDAGAAGNILTSNGSGWVSAAPAGVPSGAIIMWSGAIASIPAGWFLCDGNNNTPNLIDRFVIAAGGSYGVGAVGGTKDAVVVAHSHTTTVSDPGHSHNLWCDNDVGGQGGSGPRPLRREFQVSGQIVAATTGITVTANQTGQDGTNANLPPYLALAYIMKA